MALYYNKIIMAGNLTADPELKHTQTGKSVCEFTLAINRKYNGNESTEFVNVEAWGQSAEFLAKYAKKGSNILVEGEWKSNTVDTDGGKRKFIKVVASSVQLIGGGKQNQEQESGTKAQPQYYSNTGNFEEVAGDDDLPF